MRLLAGLAVLVAVGTIGDALVAGDAQVVAAQTDGRPTTAERIQRASDELDIMRLQLDYGLRLDNRDFDGYAATFAEDGVMNSGIGSARGHAAIRRMLVDNFGEPPPSGVTVSSVHLLGNPLIEIDGDRAGGTLKYLFVVTGAQGQPASRIVAHYRDRYVRENGEWRIQERTSHADILAGNPVSGDGADD